MIGSLRGRLGAITGTGEVLVEVGGVGYRVQVTPATVAALRAVPGPAGAFGDDPGPATQGRASVNGRAPAAGAGPTGGPPEVFLYVHTHVREDALVLYGFRQLEERRCFEALLGAHGVGPSLALAVLAALSPDALVAAVLEEDVAALCAVPGIGKKTAARLVIDLKTPLAVPELGGGDLPGPAGTAPGGGARAARAEVRAALAELGYGPDEIRGVLEGVREELAVEDLLRRALQELAAR